MIDGLIDADGFCSSEQLWQIIELKILSRPFVRFLTKDRFFLFTQMSKTVLFMSESDIDFLCILPYNYDVI